MLNLFTSSMGDINVIPIFSTIQNPASRFLISGVRDSKKPLKFTKGLVLNNKDGKNTKRIDNILRFGKSL